VLNHRFGKDALMAQSRDSLIARRRRFDTRVKEVRAALDGTDKTAVPDAVAGALDALYDLWEYWQQHAALTMNQADERVHCDADGETAAAPVHARGAKTHVLEEFGRLTDTYGDTYRAYYGVWRWQRYSESSASAAHPRSATVGGGPCRRGLRGVGLPWAVRVTVWAPGFGDQISALASGGRQSLAVAQSLPRPRGIEFCPSAVVLVITLMEAPRKVRHLVRGDQQELCVCTRRLAALGQAVLAVAEVHVAQLALCHACHHPRKCLSDGRLWDIR
jgi:hypothetical protein